MTSPALKVCTACAHLNSPDARFCNQCGKPIANGSDQQRYTPKHLSEKILKMRSALEGERKQVTVLFADIKGSVALSQRVEAEQWHAIMDRFFGILTQSVHDYEGTVNQYTGDGIMALFGAPLAHEDHATRACRAALAMRKGILQLAVELESSHGIAFAARLGLNSGEVIVGKIGDDLRMDYTAQGQTVGLAARMEQLAKPNCILLSQHTRDLVLREFELTERSAVSVKGFESRVRVFELRGVKKAFWRRDELASGARNMIGRERELRLLQAYRERVMQQSSGLLVTISAETGMGKSRLCREFIAHCQDQGVQVYAVRGASYHRAEIHTPFLEFFASYFGLEEDDGPAEIQAKVGLQLAGFEPIPEHLKDNLLTMLGVPTESPAASRDPRRQLELAKELMLRLMHDGALHQHAVVVIENIQWLDDPDTRGFFDAMFAVITHFPVLVVVTARSDYVMRWQGQAFVRSLALQPLNDAESMAFLDAILGDAVELSELKRDIVEQAGGSPLFLDEVVRQLLNTGVLEKDGKRVNLKRKPQSFSLPPSVQAVIAARIDSLPEASKYLLQAAAVIGRRISRSLLREVFGGADFDLALQELTAQEILRNDVGADAQAALCFNQSLFQTVAYEALLSEQRQEMHLRIARALEPRSDEDASQIPQLARHLAAGGQGMQAASWYLRGAENSARSNLPEALRYLQQARDVLDKQKDDAMTRCLHLRVLARWLQFTARTALEPAQCELATAQADKLVEAGVDDASLSLYKLAQGAVCLATSDVAGALALYREAASLAGSTGDKALDVAVRVALIYGLQAQGLLSQALTEVDSALGLSGKDSDLGADWLSYSPRVALLILKAWISAWLGRLQQARGLADEALAEARARQYGEQVVAALAVSAFVATESGDATKGIAAAEQALKLARRIENTAAEMMALMALGRSQVKAKLWVEAIPSLEEALSRIKPHSFGLGESARLELDLSLAHLAAGDARQARFAAARAVKSATDEGARLALAEALLAQVRAGLYSSRPQGFLKRYQASLDEAKTLIEACQARLLEPECLLLQARWLRLRGQEAQAVPLENEAASLAAEFAIPLPLVATL